jgi:hypothetical protein
MWRFAAGQSTGSSHEKLGLSCQDRMHCCVLEREATLIAVLADGAGTAANAHQGAELAVSTVASVTELGVRAGRQDFDQVLREAAAMARQRLLEAATNRSLAVRDLACTLLAVVVSPVAGAALQIGDGAIVTGTDGAEWRWVFWPQKGEYANMTVFLTEETALARAQVATLSHDVQDVALFSDGLEPLALHFARRTAYEPFFRTAFAPLHALQTQGGSAALSQSLSQMLSSPAVRARTDDDASLILATRRLPTS